MGNAFWSVLGPEMERIGIRLAGVVRAFREAADEDSVLFFDEADVVFYNRVCILATV